MFLIKHHAINIYGEAEVQLHIFYNLALEIGKLVGSCYSHSALGYPMDRRQGGMLKRRVPPLVPARNP